MSSSRIERRKYMEQKKRMNKRKKRPYRIVGFILILFMSTIGYGIFQYYSAYISASEENPVLPISKSTEEETTDFNGVEDVEKISVLILGLDTDTDKGRTDTIMIAQYDPKSGSAKLASIMRDSYVSIPGYMDNKINQAFYHGGAELVRQTIKENFGIDVQYYAIVNFDGFPQVVDILSPDGVEIDVEKRMKYTDYAGGLFIDFQPGLQRLNGEELLEYARFRHDAESDFGRVRRQQQVISAVKDELISINGLAKLPKMLGTIQPYIDTNISTKTIFSIGTSFLKNPQEIQTIRIPIDGSYQNKSYSHAGSVLEIDKEENKQALQQFFSTETDSETISMGEVAKY